MSITSSDEREQAVARLTAETDEQLRADLAFWAVAVADHEHRWAALTNERDAVGELFREAQTWVRIVVDELAARREKARARGGLS